MVVGDVFPTPFPVFATIIVNVPALVAVTKFLLTFHKLLLLLPSFRSCSLLTLLALLLFASFSHQRNICGMVYINNEAFTTYPSDSTAITSHCKLCRDICSKSSDAPLCRKQRDEQYCLDYGTPDERLAVIGNVSVFVLYTVTVLATFAEYGISQTTFPARHPSICDVWH